jgi:hypothetical protein
MCQSAKEMWQRTVGKSEHWEGAAGFDQKWSRTGSEI